MTQLTSDTDPGLSSEMFRNNMLGFIQYDIYVGYMAENVLPDTARSPSNVKSNHQVVGPCLLFSSWPEVRANRPLVISVAIHPCSMQHAGVATTRLESDSLLFNGINTNATTENSSTNSQYAIRKRPILTNLCV